MSSDDIGYQGSAISVLHDSPHKLVLACTGAGAGLQDTLWQVAGSSRTLLYAHLPYAEEAMEEFLGFKPEKSVSEETAIDMAARSLNHARDLLQKAGETDTHALGLGLTAAVATDRDRRGKDHCHVTLACADGSRWSAYVEFKKGAWDRSTQSEFCEALALLCLFYKVLGKEDTRVKRFESYMHNLAVVNEKVEVVYLPREYVPRIELIDDSSATLYMPDGEIICEPYPVLNPAQHVLFPGSFNPLSFGHRAIERQLTEQTGKQVVFHVTRSHPDKPAIPDDQFRKLLTQFAWYAPVLVTNGDRLFVDKASMFPNFTFGIGVDALKGLLNPKYYGGEQEGVARCVRDLAARGARFAVFGRVNDTTGVFETVEDLDMPAEMRRLCIPITGRWDISSTQLRERAQ